MVWMDEIASESVLNQALCVAKIIAAKSAIPEHVS